MTQVHFLKLKNIYIITTKNTDHLSTDLSIINNFHFKNKTDNIKLKISFLAISMLKPVLAEDRSKKEMLERKCVFFFAT